MSVFKDSIWKEILDGKRDWSVPERTPDACDLFEVQIVHPLRALRDEGRIKIKEIRASVPGRLHVVQVMLQDVLRYDDDDA